MQIYIFSYLNEKSWLPLISGITGRDPLCLAARGERSLLFNAVIILIALFSLPRLLSAQQAAERENAPYFLIESQQDGVLVSMPLVSTSAEVNIVGVIADVQITQQYVNTGSAPIEASYVFPASTNAAVYAQRMRIGDRVIEGVVMERGEARATYETARSEGRRASLLEQHRPNVLQMQVANIMPGDTVDVELNYTELLVPESGVYEFVYPTVVGPRYTGEGGQDIDYADQAYTRKNRNPSYTFDLDINVDAGMPIREINSPSHRLTYTHPSEGTDIQIGLHPSESPCGNRDFILRYRPGGDGIQTGLMLFEGEDENFFLYMAQPPTELSDADFPPREYIFILDVSGSMNGFPMGVTKRLMRELIPTLRPTDRFNIVTFAGGNKLWQPESKPATQDWLDKGIAFVNSHGGGGGTNLLSAMKRSLELPRSEQGLSRSFVIVTDGYVSVEPEAFDLVREKLDEANFYAFGIGNSVNRHLIEGLAHVGRGQSFVLTDETDAPDVVDRFRRYIESPVLTGTKLTFDRFDAYDVEPISIPDLTSERPLVVFGKYKGRPRGRIELCGYGGYSGEIAHPVYLEQPVNPAQRQKTFSDVVKPSARSEKNGALQYLWARERLRRLSDYAGLSYGQNHREEIVSLGLKYNLLTQFTSFVAVEESLIANTDGELERVEQALPLPEGVSNMAVGFDLGFSGVSGLPGKGNSKVWLVFAFILVGLIGILGLLWRFRNRLFCFFYRSNFSLFNSTLGSSSGGEGRHGVKSGKPEFCLQNEQECRGIPLFRREKEGEVLIALLLLICSLMSCGQEDFSPSQSTPETLEPTEMTVGSDLAANTITYILGEDEGTNAYYERAASFFRQNSQWESAVVETGVRSIADMVTDLRKPACRGHEGRSKSNQAWQRINVVVHGNQWTGLAVAPTGSGERQRTDAQTLHALRDELLDLPASVIDGNTEVVLHGCSTSRDSSLLLALSALLGNERGEYPVVASSRSFSLFRQGDSSPQPHLQLADYYFVAAPLRQWPIREKLAEELVEKYPDAQIDWADALGRNRFSEGDAPLLYQFNVPVDWLDVFAPDSELPQPSGQRALRNYAASIDRLNLELDRLELSVDDFAWQSEPSSYTTAGGHSYPALALHGQARVFCVLQPISGQPNLAHYTRLRYTAEAR
ncbi:MAG: VIT domain-containing protein [Bacteroidota bacterium]